MARDYLDFKEAFFMFKHADCLSNHEDVPASSFLLLEARRNSVVPGGIDAFTQVTSKLAY